MLPSFKSNYQQLKTLYIGEPQFWWNIWVIVRIEYFQ
jgi:hypothetical protein